MKVIFGSFNPLKRNRVGAEIHVQRIYCSGFLFLSPGSDTILSIVWERRATAGGPISPMDQ